MKERVVLEIDLGAIKHNVEKLRNLTNSKVIAVVKANAYGLGAVEVSRYLEANGIDMFAVATIDEAMELRNNGIKGKILILGYTHPDKINILNEYDLIQNVFYYDYAMELDKKNVPIKCHIEINSGLNRTGFNYYDQGLVKNVYELPNLKVEGIFSHFSSVESLNYDDVEATNKEIENFEAVLAYLKENSIDYGITHLQGSFGTINYHEHHYDYIRPGVAMYGYKTAINDEMKQEMNFIPALKVKSKIVMIRNLRAGDYVGYDRTFKASNETKEAIIPIGYNDGFPRSLSNIGYVYVNGKKARVIGKVSMDQITVDITGIEVKVNDEVEIIGNNITLDEFANLAGMINHDALCGFNNPRVKRVYKNK